MTRAEELAADFERACEAFAATAERLTPEQWRTPAANHPEFTRGEDERRPVGVVAHHVADMIPTLAEIARMRAEGMESPPIDYEAANARHAAANPDPDQAETVALIRDAGARAAGLLGSLSDEGLGRPGRGPYAMTPEQFVRRVMIGHFAQHAESVRAAVGEPPDSQ